MKWTFSDGTVITRGGNGLAAETPSEFGEYLVLRSQSKLQVDVDRPPQGSIPLRIEDDWLLTEWLKREARSWGIALLDSPPSTPPADVIELRERLARQEYDPKVVY